MARKYDFKLPVHLTGFQCTFAPGVLKSKGLWEKMPKKLCDKITKAGWSGLDLNKNDLDSIPDDVWKVIVEYVKANNSSTESRT